MLLLALEAIAMVVGPLTMAALARAAIAGNLATARGGAAVNDAATLLATADKAIWMYLGGVGLLALGRAASVWRGRGNVAIPLLLPAVATALGLGVAVQMGYGDPAHYTGFPGRDAGRDALVAGGLGGLLLLQPWIDPVELVRRTQRLVLGGLLATFAVLLLAGAGPAGSDQKLAVFGVQPLEFVKLGFVMWMADYLGRRAPKLRWQREGSAWLRWPRPRVLFPAVAAFTATLLGLLLVHDMGPMTVIGSVFLWMLYAVTRSRGWFLVALGLVLAVIRAAITAPRLLGETFAERVGMYQDPWTNGLPIHQEVAEAMWSMASGGTNGQGPGRSLTLLRWGHNDLVLAQLTEDLGVAGLAGWVALIFAMVASCAWVAARARTPERQLVAQGMGMLLTLQAAVIFGGVTGLLPLTGIVAPFLAKGGSGFIAFTLAMVIVARVAESGERRSDEDVLTELGWSGFEGAAVAALFALGGVYTGWDRAVHDRAETTNRGVLIQLGDHTFRHSHDPRVSRLALALPRGELHDRHGAGLAVNTPAGRAWPLKDALGTLIGPTSDVQHPREPWMLERRLEERLRGWPEKEHPFEVWYTLDDRGEVTVLLAGEGTTKPEAGGATVHHASLPNPDLSKFAALIPLPKAERDAAAKALVDDLVSRSVTLTLDARLQDKASKILIDTLKASKTHAPAAAAVVIDVDTGRVLARAQWPDLDPATATWGDSAVSFTGAYGPLPDKTGLRGVLQSGSVFKLYTALSAAHAGKLGDGGPPFSCNQKDAQGPYFTRKGWPQAIHDSHGDAMHGTVNVVRGLEVSCNVYFGQLGLQLGAKEMQALADLGVEVAWGGAFKPGDDGSRQLASTAFGQGAAALHPLAAAKLAAAVGAGGVYRSCPSTMEEGVACKEVRLFDAPGRVEPILQGMRAVMTSGTGRSLKAPANVRVYGKTGTADVEITRDEKAFGIQDDNPHSWFVALAEPDVGAPSQAQRSGRLAIAVVVPRGGFGASSAGPAAMRILAAAQELGLLDGRR